MELPRKPLWKQEKKRKVKCFKTALSLWSDMKETIANNVEIQEAVKKKRKEEATSKREKASTVLSVGTTEDVVSTEAH